MLSVWKAADVLLNRLCSRFRQRPFAPPNIFHNRTAGTSCDLLKQMPAFAFLNGFGEMTHRNRSFTSLWIESRSFCMMGKLFGLLLNLIGCAADLMLPASPLRCSLALSTCLRCTGTRGPPLLTTRRRSRSWLADLSWARIRLARCLLSGNGIKNMTEGEREWTRDEWKDNLFHSALEDQ